MTSELPLSIHDNILLGYEVTSQKEIILKTEYTDRGRHELTDVIFTGIVAYQFTDDCFEAGTILNEIVDIDLETFVAEDSSLFKDSFNHWIAAENALTLLKQKALHNYAITTSLGMYGWVLCKSYELKRRN